ncbi:YMGG-like glycine zipper-containing protein [Thauera sinica]|uniref:YMGG-like glycine zipper-containing protein n=1 Tax=Thauera sp. K11 TaxID=2005884 RepID=UPI000BBA5CFE|nr:YMGG-like glycine zipper-containing protein [Thauera sp. K11]ATE60472.1 glycine zipper family protein [Thauera sp. K11]
MKRLDIRPYVLLPALLLAGCAAVPSGPRVAVMPAPGKPFDLFVVEERECRRYAEESIGLARGDLEARSAVGSAAVGTAVGAAAGALAGGERGAATGAGVGLLAGTASGTSQAAYAGADAQRRYDIAYQQCMYAKGNQIPGYASPYRYRESAPAETPYYYPPPPPRR